MAGHTQRIEQRYVHGVGASGALLAGALIAFISVVGIVSLALWPSAVDTGVAIDPGIPIPRLAATDNGPSDNGTGSLSSTTVTTPLATAQAVTAPAVPAPAAHPNGKPSPGGGNHKGKHQGAGGNGVTPGTNGGQITVVQPTTPSDSGRSGSGTDSGSGGSPSHGTKHGTNHAPSGGSGGNSSQSWDQPNSGSGDGSSGSGAEGPGNGNGHAYGHNK